MGTCNCVETKTEQQLDLSKPNMPEIQQEKSIKNSHRSKKNSLKLFRPEKLHWRKPSNFQQAIEVSVDFEQFWTEEQYKPKFNWYFLSYL
jgi:hypothetical protein